VDEIPVLPIWIFTFFLGGGDRRCSGISCSVEWQFRTEVSGQPIGPIVQEEEGGGGEEEKKKEEEEEERAGCPVTLAQNYHSALRNIPEEHRFRLHPGRSLNR